MAERQALDIGDDHPAAAAEDRRADRLRLRGRRDPRPGAGRRARRRCAAYAHDLGLAFQIADDLLDVEGDARSTGKAGGRDAAPARPLRRRSWASDGRARAGASCWRTRPSRTLTSSARRRGTVCAQHVVELRRSSRRSLSELGPESRSSTCRRTPLLDQVHEPGRPAPARRPTSCAQLADELRAETIDAVSVTGGHLGAGLGVVELTVALHHVFDTPRRPADLGRRPPGLSAQDPDRPARPHPHPAPGRRPVRLHQARRRANTTRSARRTARPRSRPASAWRWRATSTGDERNVDRGDRRRRDERRHGLRGDEQRRRDATRG